MWMPGKRAKLLGGTATQGLQRMDFDSHDTHYPRQLKVAINQPPDVMGRASFMQFSIQYITIKRKHAVGVQMK